MTGKNVLLPVITSNYVQSIKMLDFSVKMHRINTNNTSHASREICAPWGVTFFWRSYYGEI